MDEELLLAEAELNVAKKALSEAQNRESEARRRVVSLRSKRFIAANGIRRADVQMPDGPGMPYFMVASEFAKWISSQPSMKRWAEWNGMIHYTTDLLAGRLACTDGRIEDVPE